MFVARGLQQSINDCISGSGKYEHGQELARREGKKHSHTTVCYHAFISTMNIYTKW